MNVTPLKLSGALLIEPRVFSDDRGHFLETWNAERYQAAGLPLFTAQDNLSYSRQGVLRGLHFQNPQPQAKLVQALQGEIYDVIVDLRRNSPTFGQSLGEILSGENRKQLFVPVGFAHGFCVLSDSALVQYKCTTGYFPGGEVSLLWNDPALKIDWPLQSPLLSPKDQVALRLDQIPPEKLF